MFPLAYFFVIFAKFREIVNSMIRAYARIFNNTRPVYDGKKNMYTRELLPIGRDRIELEVTLPGDSNVERQFRVTLKWMTTVTFFNSIF